MKHPAKKICRKCGAQKVWRVDFKKPRWDCNSCLAVSRSKWYQDNKERCAVIQRRAVYKRKYGITPEDYDFMLEEQNGGCAICGTVPASGRRLAIDHNHETGKTRALLCNTCNIGVGYSEHGLVPSWLDYLEKHAA